MTFNDEILVTPDNLLRGMIKINSTEFRIKIDDYVNNLGSVPTRQESLITHEIGHTYANLLFPEQTFFFMFILGNNKAGHEKNNISKKYSENPSLIDINKR
ncbi:MAG TPA: hypothetical protein VL098_04845 [Flavipsychrobacter sp.]|nr:hypothetical protein [Flavipsychrobacter sp.]